MRPVLGAITVALIATVVAVRTDVTQPLNAEGVAVAIVDVTDGDTLRVQLPEGNVEPLCLIGIDTVETKARASLCSATAPRRPREQRSSPAAAPRSSNSTWTSAIDSGDCWAASGSRMTVASRGCSTGASRPKDTPHTLTIQPNSRYADRFAAAVAGARVGAVGRLCCAR